MKTRLLRWMLVPLAMGFLSAYAGNGKVELKAGDTAYICGCGEKCACETVSTKAGKCSCGHDLKKVSVTKATKGEAFYDDGGKQMHVKLTGKYACGCGGDCCQIVSKKPGKCACGKDLVEVKEKKDEKKKS